jgi:lariat debranching enzyme
MAEAILGKLPDLVLQVGDVEAHRNEEDLAGCQKPKKYRSLGNFSALRRGDIRSPAYCIGGNHEPYVALDTLPGPLPAPWGGALSVYYLGRAGARILENKLKLAWLSGIASPKADPIRRSESPRTRTYFLDTEVATTIREACDLGDIDVLLTHDWPSELRCGRGNQRRNHRDHVRHSPNTTPLWPHARLARRHHRHPCVERSMTDDNQAGS